MAKANAKNAERQVSKYFFQRFRDRRDDTPERFLGQVRSPEAVKDMPSQEASDVDMVSQETIHKSKLGEEGEGLGPLFHGWMNDLTIKRERARGSLDTNAVDDDLNFFLDTYTGGTNQKDTMHRFGNPRLAVALELDNQPKLMNRNASQRALHLKREKLKRDARADLIAMIDECLPHRRLSSSPSRDLIAEPSSTAILHGQTLCDILPGSSKKRLAAELDEQPAKRRFTEPTADVNAKPAKAIQKLVPRHTNARRSKAPCTKPVTSTPSPSNDKLVRSSVSPVLVRSSYFARIEKPAPVIATYVKDPVLARAISHKKPVPDKKTSLAMKTVRAKAFDTGAAGPSKPFQFKIDAPSKRVPAKKHAPASVMIANTSNKETSGTKKPVPAKSDQLRKPAPVRTIPKVGPTKGRHSKTGLIKKPLPPKKTTPGVKKPVPAIVTSTKKELSAMHAISNAGPFTADHGKKSAPAKKLDRAKTPPTETPVLAKPATSISKQVGRAVTRAMARAQVVPDDEPVPAIEKPIQRPPKRKYALQQKDPNAVHFIQK
ncbi:hypothetical protein DM01DRAFT_1391794 [Hesseltinella vesiculosa]|uniref:Uncharacterized protein n=1 Tax=Hesseltinella vesiculosa TaxID=101127 RepID=A0A1X2GFG9_9FUNG|nr:hypothetical protein DM01DRAFT_1391794 [Hesseltinella vesiculosa]